MKNLNFPQCSKKPNTIHFTYYTLITVFIKEKNESVAIQLFTFKVFFKGLKIFCRNNKCMFYSLIRIKKLIASKKCKISNTETC